MTADIDVITAEGMTLLAFGAGTPAAKVATAFARLPAGLIVTDGRMDYACPDGCDGNCSPDGVHQIFFVGFSIEPGDANATQPLPAPRPECVSCRKPLPDGGIAVIVNNRVMPGLLLCIPHGANNGNLLSTDDGACLRCGKSLTDQTSVQVAVDGTPADAVTCLDHGSNDDFLMTAAEYVRLVIGVTQ